MALKIEATCSECGMKIPMGKRINSMKHVKFDGKDILYSGITCFTGVKCPNCGKALNYILTENDENGGLR